jgi:DNA-binding CsgD family transcriptional regulator
MTSETVARPGQRADDAAPPGRRAQTVRIAVVEAPLRIALTHLAGECGLRVVQHDLAADIVVADTSALVSHPVHVLVVGPSSLSAALALGAVFLGQARALLSTDAPEALPRVLGMLASEIGAMPRCVVESGRHVLELRLSQRQHALLGILANGYAKDSQVARRLGVSLATLKREVRMVGERMEVGNRHELADLARSLGYCRPLRESELRLLTPFAPTADPVEGA